MLNLPARPAGRTDLVDVVIDTPRGSRNKYKFDATLGCFRLSRILPCGASFPLNFGFIPSTRAEDGDALDVLIVMDDPMPIGTLLTARLFGVLTAEQTAEGNTIHNDRLLAVPVTEANPARIHSLNELDPKWLDEIEHFFISYNRAHGRMFTPRGRLDRDAAERLLAAALEHFSESH